MGYIGDAVETMMMVSQELCRWEFDYKNMGKVLLESVEDTVRTMGEPWGGLKGKAL